MITPSLTKLTGQQRYDLDACSWLEPFRLSRVWFPQMKFIREDATLLLQKCKVGSIHLTRHSRNEFLFEVCILYFIFYAAFIWFLVLYQFLRRNAHYFSPYSQRMHAGISTASYIGTSHSSILVLQSSLDKLLLYWPNSVPAHGATFESY